MYASVGREVCRGMQGSRGPWGLVGGYLGRGGEGSLPYASNDLGAREKKSWSMVRLRSTLGTY